MALAVQRPVLSLAQLADDLDVPEGYRVEIIGETIVVSPTPSGFHALVVTLLQAEIQRACPSGHLPFQMVTLTLPATGERYVPDLVVLPRKLVADRREWLFPGTEALLAVEIVSPANPENDRVRKVRGYAVSGVPAYLLVDPLEETVALFEQPASQVYRRCTRVGLGETITLPEPFELTLDTAAFLADD